MEVNPMTGNVLDLVETRSGMRLFVRAIREGWPMNPAERDAAIRRLQEIGREDRGRISFRARQAVHDVEAALAGIAAGVDPASLPKPAIFRVIRRRKCWWKSN